VNCKQLAERIIDRARRQIPVRRWQTVTLLALAILSGCAEVQLFGHAAKEINGALSPEQASKGIYKVGNPYQVAGVWYYPKVEPDYDATGIASWYGTEFHGLSTANGEAFDMNEITAAHQTLPLPSLVRVTNLENGRSMVVRVNDRGPFVNGRVLDMSRRGAQLLGFETQGTARVRVQMVASPAPDVSPTMVANAAPGPRSSNGGWSNAKASDAPDGVQASTRGIDRAVTTLPVQRTNIFIQVGAFAQHDNAAALRGQLTAFGPAKLSQVTLRGTEFYRVRVGPVANVAEADRKLASLIAAGHSSARIVVD
jgi:rare lipoprotein A